MNNYNLILAIIGIAALAMAWMPAISQKSKISYSIFYVLLGVIVYSIFKGLPLPDPLRKNTYTLRLSELAVIISLMGTGLKINTRFRLKTWAVPFKLVFFTMIICIAVTALYTWSIFNISISAALLIGSVLAPTDPVLASDVQVGEPQEKKDEKIRFALTAEAGMNDGMAFPFTWLAVALALNYGNTLKQDLTTWFAYDLCFRIAAGIVAGFLLGRLIAYLLFTLSEKYHFLKTNDGFVAIAATLLVYGLTELIHGYGFIAVFVSAITIRNSEMFHEYHTTLHSFAEQTERILVAIILILFGGSLVSGIFDGLDWNVILFSTLFIFIIRPLAGLIAVQGKGLTLKEKWCISFFGIRGIGSFFYLAFALKEAVFDNEEKIWATAGMVVLLSIFVHGATASHFINSAEKASSENNKPPHSLGSAE